MKLYHSDHISSSTASEKQGEEHLPRIKCATNTSIINVGKGKDRVQPRTGHENPHGE